MPKHITKSNYEKFYTVSRNYYEVIDGKLKLNIDTNYKLIEGKQEVFTKGFINVYKCIYKIYREFRVQNPATDDDEWNDEKRKPLEGFDKFVISIADHELSIYGTIHR